MIAFIAFAIPRFAIVLNIIGGVAGTSLQFIIPIMMYNKVFKDELTTPIKIKNYTMLIVGIIGGLSATVGSLIELIKPADMD
jgi:proton-coupled amino acid transporter